MNVTEILHRGHMQKKAFNILESMLKTGFNIFVESLVDKRYTVKEGFYLHEGAVGRIVDVEYIPAIYEEDEEDYLVRVEWLKDKIVTYSLTGAGIHDYDLKSSIKPKDIVPPKNPNQLELIFK